MADFPTNPSDRRTPLLLAFLLLIGFAAAPSSLPAFQADSPATNQAAGAEALAPDFNRLRLEQAATDRAWRAASRGVMRMEKIAYRSQTADLDIPAFVFRPLMQQRPKSVPGLVWVHENIRGHLYEHYIPYVRDAVSRGYVVIAPEYRGSIGYGQTLYDAIDYGGGDVDDVVTAMRVVTGGYPEVDPDRMGIIGWSHGGLIALLAIFRNPTTFKAGAAIVPVSNLFERIAAKGDRQREAMDPHHRFGGTPSERRDAYVNRSPLFQVDKLRIPLLVHMADNDEDVTIQESLPLLEALRSRKPTLSDTKLYRQPPGGHLFDRLVDPATWRPKNTDEQRDSWTRVWGFFERQLVRTGATESRSGALRR